MKYIKKVIIQNFQSHRDTRLELSPGLNVITGPSDQGKSAIIRALRWLFFNEPRGSQFLRVGASTCRVEVELDDGTVIARERAANRNRYILRRNGEERIFEGFGHDVPPEVVEASGIRKAVLDDNNEIVLHISSQLEGPFLLAETGATKARAIGRLKGVHVVDAALGDVALELTRLQAEERNLTRYIQEREERLQEFADLPAEGELLARAEELFTRAEEAKKRLEVLHNLRSRLQYLDEERRKTAAILQRLPELSMLEEKRRALDLQAERYLALKKLAERLSTVNSAAAQAASFLERTREVSRGEAIIRTAEEKKERLLRLKEVRDRWRRVDRECRAAAEALQHTAGAATAIPLVARLEEAVTRQTALKKVQQELARVEEALAKGRYYIAEKEKELVLRVQQYEQLLLRAGKCPLCLRSIDRETVNRIVAEVKDDRREKIK